MIQQLPLIVFDMDGTVIQSNIDYFGIRQKMWDILHDVVSEEDYRNIVDSPRSIIELVDLIGLNDKTNTKVKQAWDLIHKGEIEGYEDASVDKEVYETLEYLKDQKYTMIIYTNNSRTLTDYGLENFKLNHYFDFVLTRDDVKNPKPHPEGLEIILEKYLLPNTDVLFIGDSWIDAETAVNARVKFIYFGSEGAPGTRRKVIQPDYTIENMKEIIPIIENF
jgi:phosphoglycolate phosphatase/pyrophosphatase PpaX